jgi:hypothetical protein
MEDKVRTSSLVLFQAVILTFAGISSAEPSPSAFDLMQSASTERYETDAMDALHSLLSREDCTSEDVAWVVRDSSFRSVAQTALNALTVREDYATNDLVVASHSRFRSVAQAALDTLMSRKDRTTEDLAWVTSAPVPGVARAAYRSLLADDSRSVEDLVTVARQYGGDCGLARAAIRHCSARACPNWQKKPY